MRKLVSLSLCCLFAVACGDDDSTLVDGGPRIDIGMTDTNMVDSGPPDTDRPDTPPSGTCNVGAACTATRGCRDVPGACIPEQADMIGSTSDPIMNGPGGATTAPATFWPEGYCTTVAPSTAVPFPCDPENPADPVCGSCGVCVNAGTQSLCLDACAPSVADNADCRDGYECSFGARACVPGCAPGDSNEVECRTARVDMNDVDGIQTPADCMRAPADCGGMANNFDPLVYDPESMASCNPATFQCDDPDRDADARGGDPCVMDNECELRGFCITEVAATDEDPAAWLGGSCIKTGCDITGNECANGGKCDQRSFGDTAVCLAPCTVGEGADPTMPTGWLDGASARGGCREGYACSWDGLGASGVADNGACLPIVFDATITEPSIGTPCVESSECYSPFGRGRCLRNDFFPNGYCTVNDCAAPVFSGADAPSVCGEPADATCVGLGGDADPAFALCVQLCESGMDCADSLGCIAITATVNGCFAGCEDDADCNATQQCGEVTIDGETVAQCVDR